MGELLLSIDRFIYSRDGLHYVDFHTPLSELPAPPRRVLVREHAPLSQKY